MRPFCKHFPPREDPLLSLFLFSPLLEKSPLLCPLFSSRENRVVPCGHILTRLIRCHAAYPSRPCLSVASFVCSSLNLTAPFSSDACHPHPSFRMGALHSVAASLEPAIDTSDLPASHVLIKPTRAPCLHLLIRAFLLKRILSSQRKQLIARIASRHARLRFFPGSTHLVSMMVESGETPWANLQESSLFFLSIVLG